MSQSMLFLCFRRTAVLKESHHSELLASLRDLVIKRRGSDLCIPGPEGLDPDLSKCLVSLMVQRSLHASVMISRLDHQTPTIWEREEEVNPLGRKRCRLAGRQNGAHLGLRRHTVRYSRSKAIDETPEELAFVLGMLRVKRNILRSSAP